MPSPLGHALGGLAVGLAAAPPRDRSLIVLCAAAACLPDIDFAWGRHNMETHSFGFALLLGAAVLAWQYSARAALATAAAVGTHVLFDWLGSDDSPPLGVMALWPFTSQFYFAEAYVFEAISRRYWRPGFIEHNLLAVVREIAILGPVLGAAYLLRRNRRRSPPSPEA
jgi:membrane-bound metal-dependent hydrolase YbcI (DUF457 family)